MVRLAGIEPTTPWFVAKYSIQLSYSRQSSNYIQILKPIRENPDFSSKAFQHRQSCLHRQERNEKASELFSSEACRLVRLAGIEPTTPWFVAKYSIQLSYSRQASNYILVFEATKKLAAISDPARCIGTATT